MYVSVLPISLIYFPVLEVRKKNILVIFCMFAAKLHDSINNVDMFQFGHIIGILFIDILVIRTIPKYKITFYFDI